MFRTQHICEFTKTCKTLDALYPPTLKFSRLRRKFREGLLVSEENGRKCLTPQGLAGYNFQKEKHLTQNFYMIHPYSKFREYWEIFALFEFYLGFLVRSFIFSQFPGEKLSLKYQIPVLMADLFETSDVFLRFSVGYMDKEIQEIVMERRKIFFHIIKTFSFYVEAIVSFPLEFFTYLLLTESSALFPVIQHSIFFKCFKMYRMTRYLLHVSKIYNWKEITFRTIWVLLTSFLICHWFACLHYSVILSPSDYQLCYKENPYSSILFFFFRYVKSLYTVVSILFGNDSINCEIFDISIENQIFFGFMIVILNFAGTIFLGLFLQILALVKPSGVAYDEMKQEIQRYLAQENLPSHFHKKVNKYLLFHYSQCYFNENLIYNTLSPPIRREIREHLCLNLMKRQSSIFRFLPNTLASDLCLLVKYEIFLPGDVIFRAGGKSKNIYFLYSGSVGVYASDGREVMHWYEGQQFGTTALTEPPVHPVTVVALEMTECYLLKCEDFLKTMIDFPQYLSLVNKAAKDRVHYVAGLTDKE